ncbi:Cullin-associated NEDD8-dissociated protein 1 OS=Dictyostelium discoideum GN=cand1 PE=3 SV=1 [Rhizoctonia solani AG-1 IB]|uniref:Cullin-associated NEDD8-dissociated protein 1 n=1 Tax=Thanatephorus cucumeris (strain AG1-IB / isolate 7/3/14) TaxID=1108050 RepID=A0A0B7FSW0_THACB|nr:Cullin-associated NEDD8-dissociated protein 1 OS=Dictyostelium discoideum GN=cand1 PE=3 SV=1 [Rhizoctonia solani AG-1 IB]
MAPQQLQMRIEKMQSSDSDLRYMALNDLANDLAKNQLGNQDEQSEAKLTRQVVSLLADKNSEVKNQAVKCLGQLIKVVRSTQMDTTIDQLIEYSGGKDDELRDIAGLALKTVTAELPLEGTVAPRAIQKLVPKLLQQLGSANTPPDALIETLATLTILVTRFPSHVPPQEPMNVLTPLLLHARPAVRKRATTTIASFVPTLSQTELQEFISSTILPGLQPSAPLEKQRTTVHLVAAVARYLASSLSEVVPSVLKGVDKDDEELREAGLQALELLTLRCPSEITPFLPELISTGTTYIKYDPNYAGDDDEDEPMEDEDEDEDEDGGQYSDDEDTSYKIRRSATKLLAAVITTKPAMAEELYSSVAPVLASRFADREPTVRYEVWTALTLLIRQPSPALDTLAPKFLKQLLKTLSPKTAPPAQALTLLNTLLTPDTFDNKLLGGTEEQLFKILVHPEALPTFSLLVKHALPSEDVKQKLVSLMHERHPRVAADAIKAGIELLQKSQDSKLATALQYEARERLKNSSTDAAVRAVCARAIGALFVAKAPYEEEDWELVRRSGAVGVVAGVLKEIKEKEVEIALDKAWLDANIVWAVDLVRKGSSSAKVEAIGCLEALLADSQGEIPESVQTPLIENLTTYISQSDPQLLIKSLELLTFLLRNWPKEWFAPIESQILPRIYPLATCTLLPASLDALRGFLYALSSADEQIASHLVGGLKIAYDKAGTGASNVSKCLGAVVRAQTPIAAGTINEFAKHIKPTTKASQTSLVLCLLTVGEIGRFIDMSNQHEVFDNSLAFFKSDAEEIRNAAAFAVGNIAIGSQERFLPVIVKLVQTDDEKRLLSMNALKEVVSHCSQAHLESIAESLWQPLFDTGSSHEKALNIAASCLGKLTTTNPARFLPPLEARLQDSNPTVRALVVSAMRHMFGFEGVNGLDELLKPFVVVFLGLLDDKDLNVKRLALAALNQAARNKPRLIEDQLPALLPKLYDETTPKPELIRIMEMGPWRHKIDDGLEARRTAYETMYTLLDTSLSKLGLDEFLTIVLRGLSDESNEVKVLCHMMLHRLSQVAPSATSQRLDETVEPLRAAMKEVTMDKNTVKQDLEQAAELQRSALRAAAALNTLSHPGAPKFIAFVESLEKGKLASEFREQKA